jgi:two-component system sensor histidine kinase BarA
VLLLALLPTTLAALLLGLYQMHTRLQDLEQAHQQRGQAIVNQLALAAEFAVFTQNNLILRQLTRAVLGEADVIDVVIYNALGETVMRGRREADGHLTIDPDLVWPTRTGWIFDASILRTPVEVSGDAFLFSDSEPDDPDDLSQRLIGSVTVELARDPVTHRQRHILLTTLVLLLICLLGAALAGWRLERTITGPIVALGTTVRQLREGDLSARVEERSTTELGALESGINEMAAALQTSRDRLQQQVDEATQELTQTLGQLEQQNTELKLARHHAEQASHSKSEFLATMSHEIRTPLHGVSGFLRLLARTPLSSRQADYVRLLTASADSLMTIINSVLDFIKIEANQLELDVQCGKLSDILECAVYLYGANARDKGLQLELSIDADVPTWVLVDRQRFSQVISNLVSNAVKFTDRGRITVHVNTQTTNTHTVTVQLIVSDTGPGIAPEDLERIFQAFQQLDTSRTRPQAGTGLGLAICRRLVDLLGGKLTVDSEPGQGSRFIVTLPLGIPTEIVTKQPLLTVREPLDKGPLATERVLIVDDNRVNRRLARSILEPLTSSIEDVASGAEALNACQTTRYDLILMDIRMPGLDGIEVTQRLRNTTHGLNHRTPIIGITADLFGEDRDVMLSAGMNDCVYKPLSPESLEAVFRRWIGDSPAP